MSVLFSLLLVMVIMTGAVGYLITSFGTPSRRKRKAREVFFWMMAFPAILLLIATVLSFFARAARR